MKKRKEPARPESRPFPRLEVYTGITKEDGKKWSERLQQALRKTSEILYFVPNQLRKRMIESEILWENREIFQGQRVWTLRSWLEKSSLLHWLGLNRPQKGIKKLSIQLLLEEVIRRLRGPQSVGQPGLARRFAFLVSEIKESMVERDGAAVKAFLQQLGESKGDFRSQVLLEYEKLREASGLQDPGDLLLLFCQALSRGEDEIFSKTLENTEVLILDGFYFLQPVEETILQLLMPRVKENLIYIPLSRQTIAQEDDAFALPRRTLHFFLNQPFFLQKKTLLCHEEAPENSRSFGRLFLSLGEEKPLEKPQVSFLRGESRAKEMEAIALRIQQLLREQVPPSEILVTFPQYHVYAPLVEEIFPLFSIPYTFTVGKNLHQIPPIEALLRLMELPLKDFERQEVLDVLRSPYLKWEIGSGKDAVALDSVFLEEMTRLCRITGQGIEEWRRRLEEGEKALQGKKKAIPLDLETYRKQKKALLSLLEAIPYWKNIFSLEKLEEKILNLLKKLRIEDNILHHGLLNLRPSLLQRDYEGMEKFEKTLEEVIWTFRQIGKKEIPGEQFFRILREKVSEQSLSGAYLESNRVAVLGLLDTRGLEFSHVFMGGFLEGEFPRYPEYDILLSMEERKKLGWANPSLRSLAEEKLLFILLLQSTQQRITLSCPANEGSNPILPSPFLQNVKELASVEKENHPSPYIPEKESALSARYFCDIFTGRMLREGKLKPAEIKNILKFFYPGSSYMASLLHSLRVSGSRDNPEKITIYEGFVPTEEVRKKIRERLKIFSASQLETYAKCSYRFFHERVLYLKAMEEVEEEITAMERGNLIHDTLFLFFQWWKNKYPGEKISQGRVEEAEKKLLEITRDVFSKEEYSALSGMAWKSWQKNLTRGLDQRGGTGLLKEILQKELASDTIPGYFEWSFGEFNERFEEGTDPNRTKQNFLLESKESIPSFLPLPPTSLQIRGKIDRIDFFLQDWEEREKESIKGPVRIEVCDYKTGQHSQNREVKEGVAYQLPLYLLAAIHLLPPEGGPYIPGRAVYYELKKIAEVKKANLLKDNMEHYLDLVQAHILEDMKSLEAGYFPTTLDLESTAEKGYCHYCPAFSICSANPRFTLSVEDSFQQKVLQRKEKIWEERSGFFS